MALSFPSSPTLYQTTTTGGQTWTWNGNNWYVASSGGGASVTVANSAPASPTDGSMWLNSDSGVFSVFYNTSNVWLGFVGGGSSGGTSLPSFTGNTGKFLTNDGAYSSWGNVTIPSVTAAAVSDQLNTSTGYFSLPTGNTAQRPGTPVAGATRINSQTNYFETYYNSNWFNLTYIGVFAATGGTITTSGNYRYHTFLASGTFTVTASPVGGTISILAVAGGGGGGFDLGGGGGAGGAIYNSTFTAGLGAISIVVGSGGPASLINSTGTNGVNTTLTGAGIATQTAIGGGGGGSYVNGGPVGTAGASGGSGGGAASAITSSAAGTVGQGYAGGAGSGNTVGTNDWAGSGGGGGAGGAGGNGSTTAFGANSAVYGYGGVGLADSAIGGLLAATATGVSSGGILYIAGGGGSNSNTNINYGIGGKGGGGSYPNTAGTTNSGGGGGGGGLSPEAGGNGGSGLVIIGYRYQ